MNKFHNRLREGREAQGVSQTELAARAGVGLATLNRVERWHFRVSPKTAGRLAGALGAKVTALFPYLTREGHTR